MLLDLDGCHVNDHECFCSPSFEDVFAKYEPVRRVIVHNKVAPIQINTKQDYNYVKEVLDGLLREIIFIDIDLKFEKEMLNAAIPA